MNYQDYLRTDHWKVTRARALVRSGNRCILCQSKIRLEVHHSNYSNLWHEPDRDIVVLCDDCHKRHHASMLNPVFIEVIEEVTPEPPRIPRQVTEAEFQTIKELWIKENRIVLDAQAGRITEDARAEAIAEIRAEIDFIRYEV